MVIPERLLIDIPEQVIGFDADIGSVDRAFEQAPEVLHTVRVDATVNIALSVIDDLMLKFGKVVIGLQFVREQAGTGLYIVANHLFKFRFTAILDYLSANFATALQDRSNNSFPEVGFSACLVTLAQMHEAGFTADQGFIGFDFPRQFVRLLALEGQARTLQHEPCRLLGYSHGTVDFIGRNAVLAVRNQPDYRKPLIKADRRVFKDRASLKAELTFGMMAGTLPAPRCRIKGDLLAFTDWACYTVRPTLSDHPRNAVVWIREVSNCFFKGAWRLSFHVSSVAEMRGPVKYIFTEVLAASSGNT